jgi:hypothetical protein
MLRPDTLRLAKYFGALDADGQPRASFGAARLEHIAPAGRAHFAAKPMHAQAVQSFRLIRSFHVDKLLNKMEKVPKKSRGQTSPRGQAQIIHARGGITKSRRINRAFQSRHPFLTKLPFSNRYRSTDIVRSAARVWYTGIWHARPAARDTLETMLSHAAAAP